MFSLKISVKTKKNRSLLFVMKPLVFYETPLSSEALGFSLLSPYANPALVSGVRLLENFMWIMQVELVIDCHIHFLRFFDIEALNALVKIEGARAPLAPPSASTNGGG